MALVTANDWKTLFFAFAHYVEKNFPVRLGQVVTDGTLPTPNLVDSPAPHVVQDIIRNGYAQTASSFAAVRGDVITALNLYLDWRLANFGVGTFVTGTYNAASVNDTILANGSASSTNSGYSVANTDGVTGGSTVFSTTETIANGVNPVSTPGYVFDTNVFVSNGK